MAAAATRFVNKTRHMVKMQVGSNQYRSDLASIKPEGGEYKLTINMNDTYREFTVVVGSEPKMVVSSDDCCDFQCITFAEVEGKIEMLRQPRESLPTSVGGSKKPWFSWGVWFTSVA